MNTYYVLIREVTLGEMEYCMHSRYLLPKIVISRGVSFLESVLQERNHCVHYITMIMMITKDNLENFDGTFWLLIPRS